MRAVLTPSEEPQPETPDPLLPLLRAPPSPPQSHPPPSPKPSLLPPPPDPPSPPSPDPFSPSPSPLQQTYLHTEPPPPTHEGTRSASKPRGCTPRRRAHHPGRTRCEATAAPSPRATGRTWVHPRHGRSPAACRPRMPLPTSTPGCTRVPTAPCGGPAPLRRRDCVCTPASGRVVRLQKDRPASEGPNPSLWAGGREQGGLKTTVFAWSHFQGLPLRPQRSQVPQGPQETQSQKVTGWGHTETLPLPQAALCPPFHSPLQSRSLLPSRALWGPPRQERPPVLHRPSHHPPHLPVITPTPPEGLRPTARTAPLSPPCSPLPPPHLATCPPSSARQAGLLLGYQALAALWTRTKWTTLPGPGHISRRTPRLGLCTPGFPAQALAVTALDPPFS